MITDKAYKHITHTHTNGCLLLQGKHRVRRVEPESVLESCRKYFGLNWSYAVWTILLLWLHIIYCLQLILSWKFIENNFSLHLFCLMFNVLLLFYKFMNSSFNMQHNILLCLALQYKYWNIKECTCRY